MCVCVYIYNMYMCVCVHARARSACVRVCLYVCVYPHANAPSWSFVNFYAISLIPQLRISRRCI